MVSDGIGARMVNENSATEQRAEHDDATLRPLEIGNSNLELIIFILLQTTTNDGGQIGA